MTSGEQFAAASTGPSLLERYLSEQEQQPIDERGQAFNQLSQDPNALISSLIASLNAATHSSNIGGQALSSTDLISLVSQVSTSLASLRSTSHFLSDTSKEERTTIAAARQRVDDARLALENARLEEGELREEIRREEME